MAKAKKKVTTKQGDVDPVQAVALLKEEILSEVRLISTGKKSTAYQMVELGKQLIALENVISPKAKSKAQAPKEVDPPEELPPKPPESANPPVSEAEF